MSLHCKCEDMTNFAQFLDLRRAVQEYPLSRRKIQQLIKESRLPAFRLDGKVIIRRQDIERLLTSNPVGADIDRLVDETVAEVLGGGKL